ncbi:2'-5' RNA ligase family protein [Hydrogenophaga sp.]|uniref:2'-5' RNA ligase family protein n=1 Tax=Hydrogenophaga sp. TaxID=1904254 RepID=UPI002FC6BB5F
MPPERLHITLLPLGRFEGRVPDTVLEQAQAAGAAVDDEPFDVVFNVLRSRGGSPFGTVELAGHGLALRRLRRLQRDLRERLIRVGFPADQLRAGFIPHMTLHGQGRHEVLERWPLRQRQQVFSGWEPDFSMSLRRA